MLRLFHCSPYTNEMLYCHLQQVHTLKILPILGLRLDSDATCNYWDVPSLKDRWRNQRSGKNRAARLGPWHGCSPGAGLCADLATLSLPCSLQVMIKQSNNSDRAPVPAFSGWRIVPPPKKWDVLLYYATIKGASYQRWGENELGIGSLVYYCCRRNLGASVSDRAAYE